MTDKKKVIVFTTGGTIAMKFDPKVNGLVPAVSGADLAPLFRVWISSLM